MNKQLEKLVINEVKSELAEIDLDSITDPKRIKSIVAGEVDRQVLSLVSQEIQMSIYKSIKKKMPIIDASVNEIVKETLYRVDNLLKGDKYD